MSFELRVTGKVVAVNLCVKEKTGILSLETRNPRLKAFHNYLWISAVTSI